MNQKSSYFSAVNLKTWLILMSVILSFLLIFILSLMWYKIVHTYEPAPNQLVHVSDVTSFLDHYQKKNQENNKLITIPTGLFIQSFFFKDPNTISITGYIWQKYSQEALAHGISKGLVMPENNVVNQLEKAYEIKYGDYTVIGWRFRGFILYQKFEYDLYPFDQQTIWIRLWHQDFYKNVILTPDLESYESTRRFDIFGLEKDFVTKDFQIDETYFTYNNFSYDTNFGIKNYVGQHNFPELLFNIVIKRQFFHGFLVYFLPVFILWGILYGLVLIMTNHPKKAKTFGFSTAGTFSVLAATFFTTLVAQINLRDNLAGHPATYIEHFYFITYTLIFLVAMIGYFSTPGKSNYSFLAWENNLLPKLLFWPILLASVVILTWVKFF